MAKISEEKKYDRLYTHTHTHECVTLLFCYAYSARDKIMYHMSTIMAQMVAIDLLAAKRNAPQKRTCVCVGDDKKTNLEQI